MARGVQKLNGKMAEISPLLLFMHNLHKRNGDKNNDYKFNLSVYRQRNLLSKRCKQ